MRIVYFGSDDFAATNLKQVLASKHEVLACVTGPDKPQGRGMKITLSPIKQIALDYDIPYLQPITLKDVSVVEALKKFNADIYVVVAYGRLLTQEILDLPQLFCINVHGSLLPLYRGAAPVNWAILNGDKETGVTIQKMALALDAGDVIAQEKMAIASQESAADLRRRMADVGARLLVKTLDAIEEGQFQLREQDPTKVTYASKLSKEMGLIDWSKKAHEINNQIRGLLPWPGAYTLYDGKSIKISQAEVTDISVVGQKPGEIIAVDKKGFSVACKDKALLILEVHPQAGKLMPASSFVAGYRLTLGSQLLTKS